MIVHKPEKLSFLRGNKLLMSKSIFLKLNFEKILLLRESVENVLLSEKVLKNNTVINK